jgi:hypothetical protein
MGPDELDDLLASIRAESKKESALALYEGTRETDLVSEEVDERILKLIGIDDVFDIDYSTYLTLLRERLAAARMTDSKIPVEEDELLRDEFRRVKGKVGRFKIKRKTISAGGIGVSGPITVSSDKFFLVSKAVIPTGKETEDGEETTSPEIMNKLDELIAAIRKDNELEKKKQEKDRRNLQNKRRRERESALEKVSKPVQRLLQKVVKPFQSILDRIMRFVQFTLLGFAFNKFVEWFADPKNQDKIQAIGRFLKDWWPSLVGAAALFFTPLGTLVKGVIGLMKFAIPAIFNLIRTNPYTALATAAFVGASVSALRNEAKRGEFADSVTLDEFKKTGKTPEYEQLQREGILQRGFGAFNQGGIIPSYNEGGMTAKNISGLRDTDGRITKSSGLDITGAGPDTQLIAAAPGEIVIPRETVQKYGSGTFMDMIRSSGKTGIPDMVNGIQLANQGGMIGGFGRVMAPRTDGKNRWASDGARSVFQMFGRNVPGTERPATYSSSDVNGYNQLNLQRSIQMGQSYKPLSGGGFGIAPTIKTVSKKPSQGRNFVQDAFANFGQNVQTIKQTTIKQEQIMRQMGVEPDGYVNLRGQPINLGPQSKAITMPGTPVPRSNIQVINLPPETLPPQKAPTPVRSGTQIPEFSITSRNTHRSVVSTVLGIADLVG